VTVVTNTSSSFFFDVNRLAFFLIFGRSLLNSLVSQPVQDETGAGTLGAGLPFGRDLQTSQTENVRHKERTGMAGCELGDDRFSRVHFTGNFAPVAGFSLHVCAFAPPTLPALVSVSGLSKELRELRGNRVEIDGTYFQRQEAACAVRIDDIGGVIGRSNEHAPAWLVDFMASVRRPVRVLHCGQEGFDARLARSGKRVEFCQLANPGPS